MKRTFMQTTIKSITLGSIALVLGLSINAQISDIGEPLYALEQNPSPSAKPPSTVPTNQSAGVTKAVVNQNSPERYQVKEGDTLWDISNLFLTDPWLWPEIWQANPRIRDPHLIFPGDVISLVYVNGRPSLRLERGVAGRTVKLKPVTTPPDEGPLKLTPQVREERLKSPIPAIPLDAIAAFLRNNRIVDLGELEAAPYVIAGETDRIIVGAGDRLYARGNFLEAQIPAYGVYRKGTTYIDPVTGEILGYEAKDIGVGKVVAQENDVTTILLSSAREEIRIGDRLLPTEQRKFESVFFPSAPEQLVKGEIIAVLNGVTQIGQFDVVTINRGSRDGMEVGNVLNILKRGGEVRDRFRLETVKLPDENAGILMAFRVFEKLSYALVLKAERPLAVNDQVQSPN